MTGSRAKALLIEHNLPLRELDALVLNDAGYQVEELPKDADPVTYAEKTKPRIVVLSIRYNTPTDWQILDQLRNNPHTRKIPVVAVSTEKREAAAAAATTNVSETVVAPYDISALENAVAAALGKPPAAAVLPSAQHPVPPDFVIAADALLQESRPLVLRTVETLLRMHVYQHHFSGLTPELVDNLGLLLGAIIDGLRKDLPPDQVFTTQAIQRTIHDHLRLRKGQGIGLEQVVRETQALEKQVDKVVQGLIGPSFSATDALDVTGKVRDFIDALDLIEIAEYAHL